jgi:beta-ureidopropionase / N-carbamoyl-L-amino-acid hydrolase
MLASGGATSGFTREWVYARADRDGKTFGDELARIGYRGSGDARPGAIAAATAVLLALVTEWANI